MKKNLNYIVALLCGASALALAVAARDAENSLPLALASAFGWALAFLAFFVRPSTKTSAAEPERVPSPRPTVADRRQLAAEIIRALAKVLRSLPAYLAVAVQPLRNNMALTLLGLAFILLAVPRLISTPSPFADAVAMVLLFVSPLLGLWQERRSSDRP